jgi:hypothetical protein
MRTEHRQRQWPGVALDALDHARLSLLLDRHLLGPQVSNHRSRTVDHRHGDGARDLGAGGHGGRQRHDEKQRDAHAFTLPPCGVDQTPLARAASQPVARVTDELGVKTLYEEFR